MSVTRTPVQTEPSAPAEDPTDPGSVFYRDLEHHLRARALYEEAKDAADRFRDRVKFNVEEIGHKDDTGSFVVSFEEEGEPLEVAGSQVKFVKSERYRKAKGQLDAEKAQEMLTPAQWEKATSIVITIELPGHAPASAVVDAVQETLKDAQIDEGVAVNTETVLSEDKLWNLNYFDGPDQLADADVEALFGEDEYATRLIVKKS
jgi:hypothetical protein